MPREEAWAGVAAIARDVTLAKRTRLKAYNMIVARTDPVQLNVQHEGAPLNIAFVLGSTEPQLTEKTGVLELASDNVHSVKNEPAPSDCDSTPPAPGHPDSRK